MAVPPHDPVSSTGRSRLRRIDHALVPRLQRLARLLGRVTGAPARGLGALDTWVAGGRPARAVTEHRGLAAFLMVALAFGAVAVHAQRYPVLQQRAREAADARAGPGSVGEGDTDGDDDGATGAVGPLAAARVDPYLRARRDALATAPADASRAAVVSFAEFLRPARVAALVDDLDVARVQYRLPERTPRPAEVAVADDLVTAVDAEVEALVADLRVEEQEVASVLESGVEDDAFRADYEARLDEVKALRNTLTSDPAIVFAVVVTGPVEALRDLAGQDLVRLVDLAPPDTVVDATTFYGVLPSDADRFTFGRQV